MKISWGTGIVISIISFITFILALVVTMTTNKDLDHDLVVEDYYKKEVDFQQQLNKKRNAQQLTENIRVEKTGKGLMIFFPKDLDLEKIEGNLFLYRPSNKKLDFEVPVALSTPSMLIPEERLVEGRWNIEINWSYNGTEYYFNEEFTY